MKLISTIEFVYNTSASPQLSKLRQFMKLIGFVQSNPRTYIAWQNGLNYLESGATVTQWHSITEFEGIMNSKNKVCVSEEGQ